MTDEQMNRQTDELICGVFRFAMLKEGQTVRHMDKCTDVGQIDRRTGRQMESRTDGLMNRCWTDGHTST